MPGEFFRHNPGVHVADIGMMLIVWVFAQTQVLEIRNNQQLEAVSVMGSEDVGLGRRRNG
jgi:hypothetical protein